MAGNRLQRTGSIFARLSGLLRAGAVKGDDVPLWYNIYKAFPPTHDPAFTRPAVMKDIQPIFYPEDIIRANFAKTFYVPECHNLSDETKISICQRFVQKYLELEKTGKFDSEDKIFAATENSLLADGFHLTRYQDDELPKSIYQKRGT